MDYEFRRNTFDDTFYAEFSMGHEALGRWLIDEIGTDEKALNCLIAQTQQIIENRGEVLLTGRAYHLSLTQEEALIQANTVFDDADLETEEQDLHLYEEESVALCGIDDFLDVLLAWRDFIRRYGRRSFM